MSVFFSEDNAISCVDWGGGGGEGGGAPFFLLAGIFFRFFHKFYACPALLLAFRTITYAKHITSIQNAYTRVSDVDEQRARKKRLLIARKGPTERQHQPSLFENSVIEHTRLRQSICASFTRAAQAAKRKSINGKRQYKSNQRSQINSTSDQTTSFYLVPSQSSKRTP